jgi:hypothetical protein
MQFVDKFRHDGSCTRGWTPISVMRSKIKIRTPSRHKAQLALHVLYDTKLVPSIRSGEYLSYSYIPHGVGAFGSHLTTSSRRERLVKRKPNTHTPPTTWDRYSPDSVSCRLGFSTIYTAIWGQTGQLQDQWPWWQRTFLGRINPKLWTIDSKPPPYLNRFGCFANLFRSISSLWPESIYFGSRIYLFW